MADKPNAYEVVAKNILAQLANGVAPWRKEWVASGYRPMSLSSRKPYKGVNHIVLLFEAMDKGYASPWWGTFKQISAQGGKVKKGEKGTPVVLWKRFETDKSTEDAPKFAAMMRYFTVFSSEQAEWEEGKAPTWETPESRSETQVIEDAQKVLDDYLQREGAPSLTFGGDRAFYSPSRDGITLPEQASFTNDASFYATAFHEMGHSTGHASRLKREGVVENHYFGSALYSEEELVAEFTAAFLSGTTGLPPHTLENSASYVAAWHKRLQNNPKDLVKAIGKAAKASDYILGVSKGGDGE